MIKRQLLKRLPNNYPQKQQRRPLSPAFLPPPHFPHPLAPSQTLLGTFLSLGLPIRDPTFAGQFQNAARRTAVDIANVRSSLRKQNKGVHDATDTLIMSLLKGGAVSRTSVLTWLADSLLVNISATVSFQYRDPSKASSHHTLLNITHALLKLSMPFVNDPKKRKLIDVGFVSNESAHLGVYTTTGDNKVDRLGGEEVRSDEERDEERSDELRTLAEGWSEATAALIHQ